MEHIVVDRWAAPNKPCRSISYFDDNGYLHRDPKDGPAYVEYTIAGKMRKRIYCEHGTFHRLDGPAIIEYADGIISSAEWYQNDIQHRDNGPAHVDYDTTGEKYIEVWVGKSRLTHRDDGPAVVIYCKGKLEREEYYVNDKLHRLDGPALIEYNANGDIVRQVFYANGKNINKEVKEWLSKDYSFDNESDRVLFKLTFA